LQSGKKTKPPINGKKGRVTDSELNILKNICQGLSSYEISKKVFLSERTIEGIRHKLAEKSGTKNPAALALWAVKNGLIEI